MFPEASPALHNFVLAALLAPTLLGMPPSDAHSAKRLAVKAKVTCCPHPGAPDIPTPSPALSRTRLELSSIWRDIWVGAAAMLIPAASLCHHYCYSHYPVQKQVQKQQNKSTLLDKQGASIAGSIDDGMFLRVAGCSSSQSAQVPFLLVFLLLVLSLDGSGRLCWVSQACLGS